MTTPRLADANARLKTFSVVEACCLALTAAAADFRQPPTVLLLATQATADSGVYQTTLRRIGAKFGVNFGRIVVLACVGLADLVEGEVNPRDPMIQAVIAAYLAAGFKADLIGLACTHYPAFAREIRSLLHPRAKLLDPVPFLALGLREFLASHDLLNPSPAPGRVFIELAEESPAARKKVRTFWATHGGDVSQLVDAPAQPTSSR